MGTPHCAFGHCAAALAALTLLLIFATARCRMVWPRPRVGHPHNWPTTAADSARWPSARARRAQGFARAPPDMRWWRWPGYAAPLELSLPLYNFQEYLYGYPPASRLPYNA